MATQSPLFQTILTALTQIAGGSVRVTTIRRLTILVTAMATAHSTKVQVLAGHIRALKLTGTSFRPSIERGVRRTLSDLAITMPACYQPLLKLFLPWDELRRTGDPLFLLLDESTRKASEHLLACSVALWGDALPLAFQLWEQNVKLRTGAYWTAMDTLFAEVAQVVPHDLFVLVDADRAYDFPRFFDRVLRHGWHFVIRLKANSSLRYRDKRTGEVGELRTILRARCPRPGTSWTGRLELFKKAGWRTVTVQAVWLPSYKERLVVISDLAAAEHDLIALYDKRFWIEANFRHAKRLGMHWEESGVQGLVHHERLLVAMAWVTLLALSNGLTEALDLLTHVRTPWGRRATEQGTTKYPEHAKESVFTMGKEALVAGLCAGATITLRIPTIIGPSLNDRYRSALGYQFETVRP